MKGNGFEYIKKNSGLKLISNVKGNYNFSRSFMPMYYLFRAFIKVTRDEVGIYGFMETKPKAESGRAH